MTVDERKMAIAYGDLLNMQELVQHILLMDADKLFNPVAQEKFALAANCLDMVMADVGRYMSEHTDFNKEEPDGRTES